MRWRWRNHRRPRLLIVALMAAFLLAIAGVGVAGPALDRGFGQDGVVRTPLPDSYRAYIALTGRGPLIEDLALQGKKAVGVLGSGTEYPFLGAVRYGLGGALDRSFGETGFADLESYFRGIAGDSQGEAIAVQPDSKIVVAGFRGERRFRESVPRRVSPLLVRLLPNGRPDRSFGPKGLVSPPLREANGEVLHGVAVQRSGRIVAVGARNEARGGEPAGLAIAFRPNGKLDRRFGKAGRVLFPHRRESEYTALRAVEVLASGKLLVVGYAGSRLLVARLHPNGGLDRSFGGGDGKVLVGDDLGNCCPTYADLAVLPGGRFVVSAEQELFRFRPNGRLDRSFGTRGVVQGAWMDRIGVASKLAVQPNGRVVVGTDVRFRDDKDHRGRRVISILRVLPNGKPDRGFGRNGAKFLALGRAAVGNTALTLPGGRVLMGGGSQLVSKPGGEDDFEYELALARLHR